MARRPIECVARDVIVASIDEASDRNLDIGSITYKALYGEIMSKAGYGSRLNIGTVMNVLNKCRAGNSGEGINMIAARIQKNRIAI